MARSSLQIYPDPTESNLDFPVLQLTYLSYIDPNAGGWLFQLLFPLFVAIGGTWMVLRKKASAIRNRWLKRKNKQPDESA